MSGNVDRAPFGRSAAGVTARAALRNKTREKTDFDDVVCQVVESRPQSFLKTTNRVCFEFAACGSFSGVLVRWVKPPDWDDEIAKAAWLRSRKSKKGRKRGKKDICYSHDVML